MKAAEPENPGDLTTVYISIILEMWK
jgi:hypothetical protein